jgi:hypothetical protein
MEKHVYEKIDILTKFIGLILIAIGIEYIIKMNWSLAVVYIVGGISISIVPFFIKTK